MDDVYNEITRNHEKTNEFIGRIKVVRKARNKEKITEPKPEEVFDVNYKEGGEIKMSKKKKEKIVMPYLKKNHKTQELEPNVPAIVYRQQKRKKKKCACKK